MPPSNEVLANVDLHAGKQAAHLLARAIERCADGAPDAIAVFDLDSTLLNNKPRQARIFQDFGRVHGVPELVGSRPEHWVSWDYRLAMQNAGMADARIDEIIDDYRRFWRDVFFTSEYCALDTPILGAATYLRAVIESGAKLYYVTGRHEGMRQGTLTSFERGGFPIPGDERVQLLMKPTLEEDDDAYKKRAHRILRDADQVVTVFDNEPTHVNDYRRAFPDALVIHLATDHSMRPILVDRGIPSIPDFSAYASR